MPENAPTIGSNRETAETWLTEHNNRFHRPSMFYKGPLIATIPEFARQISLACILKIKCYNKNMKANILQLQASGDGNEWLGSNNVLSNIPGLRKSNRIADLN